MGHIGFQIGFLKSLKTLKPKLKDILKEIEDPDPKELNEKIDFALNELKDLELKN